MGHGLATVTTALAGFGLTWLVQSSALLALGLCAGRALKRSGPAVQSAVYRTTLAAVLVCPVASALLAGAGFDGLTLRLPSPTAGDAPGPVSRTEDPQFLPVAKEEARVPRPDRLASHEASAPILDAAARATTASPTVVTHRAIPSPARTRMSWSRPLILASAVALGSATWLLGTAVLGLRLLVGQRRMARLRASAARAEPAAEALCQDLAGRMRLAAPAVLRSPFLFSPCLDGLRRPAILLPDDVGENLRETFVHELAHLARRDGLWNLLRHCAAAALWVQPLLWVLSRRLEVAAEEVCDDYVVQFGADRARYAGHLLELAERALPPVAPAGVGMISLRSLLARRIVRILDPSRSLSTRAGTRSVLVTLAAGLAGTLLAGLLGVGGGKREALAQGPAKAVEAGSEPLAKRIKTIRGQVVGDDGRPVPGATVIGSRYRPRPTGIGSASDAPRQHEFVRSVAGEDGRFELAFETPMPEGPDDSIDPDELWEFQVIATAPRFGLGAYTKDRPIRLTPGDRPVTGRIVDLEGRPVAGARVRVRQLHIVEPEVRREADRRPRPYQFPFSKSLGLDGEPFLPGGVVTGADGRFRLEGLGRDTLAELEISGPKVAFKRVKVLSKDMAHVEGRVWAADFRGLDEGGMYGADCTIAVEPTRPIEGVVRDAETREPIPGAIVTANKVSGSELILDGLVTAETDPQGRYRLVGLPPGNGHKLAVYPPLDRPYFITTDLKVQAGPGLEPVPFDIALRRGVWIAGKVTRAGPGTPARASIDYFPSLSNPLAKDYPNFNPNTRMSIAIKTRYRTDREGRFRVVGLPGRGVVTARADDRTYRVGIGAGAIAGRMGNDQLLTYDRIFPALYHGLGEVDIPDGTASFPCDLALDPGGSIKVRLVDPDGAPVVGALAWGRFPDAFDDDHGLRDASAVKVAGLDPDRPRTVLFTHRDRKLGAVLTIPAGAKDDAERTVTLRPNATVVGRLVDDKGRPAMATIQFRLIPAGATLFSNIHVASVKAGPDGHFRCDEITPGGPLVVTATNRLAYGLKGHMDPEAFKTFNLAEGLSPEPGQVLDLGTFDVKAARRVEGPAAKAGPADVPITGRVVDLEGRPVAGVSVNVKEVTRVKGDDLTPWLEAVKKGEPPWVAVRHLSFNPPVEVDKGRSAVRTDGEGRFRLEGLGGERVVGLAIQGDAVAYEAIKVVTRRMAPIAASGFAAHYGPGSETIYGADFTYTARPGRPVVGVVRDAETGQPLEGVSVESDRFAGSDYVEIRPLKATTDAQGKFRLVGLPKGKGNQVIAIPDDDLPYFMREARLADPPGIGPVTLEIELHRGIWITGKVTNKATGEPVTNARLHYLPFLDNEYVRDLPEFDRDGDVDGPQIRYTTKADGTYQLVGRPGWAIVGVDADTAYRRGEGADSIPGLDETGRFKTYDNPLSAGRTWPLSMKEINPDKGTEHVALDLQLDPGLSVRLKVLDAEGNPVSGVSVTGCASYGMTRAFPDAEFAVRNFGPEEERNVVIRHEGRNLGKVLRVRARADAGGPLVVTLLPLATIRGRAVDHDGHPVPATRINAYVKPTGDFGLSLPEVVAGADGRFEVAGAPTGCDYSLRLEAGTLLKGRRRAFAIASIQPGETTDVGDITFKKD